jgi:hypothetical protein
VSSFEISELQGMGIGAPGQAQASADAAAQEARNAQIAAEYAAKRQAGETAAPPVIYGDIEDISDADNPYAAENEARYQTAMVASGAAQYERDKAAVDKAKMIRNAAVGALVLGGLWVAWNWSKNK